MTAEISGEIVVSAIEAFNQAWGRFAIGPDPQAIKAMRAAIEAAFFVVPKEDEVERVAVAIFKAKAVTFMTWEDVVEETRNDYRCFAIAAIAAMTTPQSPIIKELIEALRPFADACDAAEKVEGPISPPEEEPR